MLAAEIRNRSQAKQQALTTTMFEPRLGETPPNLKAFGRPVQTWDPLIPTLKSEHTSLKKLDFQVENQPRAAYIGRTALVCVEECVHSVMFLKKQLQA